MSLSVAALEYLASKGLSLGEVIEFARIADVPEKRSAGAERQARYRARLKGEGVTGDVTRDGDSDATDVTEAPLSRPPNENNSNPPTHTPEHTPRARKGHRLPGDWEPQPLTGEIAESVVAWPPGAIERELAKFKDWGASATGQIALKADWQAAWRNWVRRAIDEGRVKQNGNERPRDRGGSTRNAAQIALERLHHG